MRVTNPVTTPGNKDKQLDQAGAQRISRSGVMIHDVSVCEIRRAVCLISEKVNKEAP